jgi:hypothetical protein
MQWLCLLSISTSLIHATVFFRRDQEVKDTEYVKVEENDSKKGNRRRISADRDIVKKRAR